MLFILTAVEIDKTAYQKVNPYADLLIYIWVYFKCLRALCLANF
jgi:hypothetical protein